MMTNLFSIFDPSSSLPIISMNWISMITPILLLPSQFWTSNSRLLFSVKKMLILIFTEIKTILMKGSYSPSLILISMLIFIAMNNSLGLLPFSFTSTSHLTTTLTLSLPLWLGFMSFSLINNTSKALAHILPLNTPALLMPFMVVIETLSNVIRPLTLAIRLSANMIAGHLLMSLMSSAIMIINPITNLSFIILLITLMMLELAVSLIQAYVFTILCTLYIKET